MDEMNHLIFASALVPSYATRVSAIIDWAEKYDANTEAPPEFIRQLRKDPRGLRRKILKGLA